MTETLQLPSCFMAPYYKIIYEQFVMETGIEDQLSNHIYIFQNPSTSGIFTISGQLGTIKNAVVYNTLG